MKPPAARSDQPPVTLFLKVERVNILRMQTFYLVLCVNISHILGMSALYFRTIVPYICDVRL